MSTKLSNLLLAVIAITLAGCDNRDQVLHGYVEARLTYLSSPSAGKLIELTVARGEHVKAGSPLYVLEGLPESAEVESATALMKQADSNYANLLVGKRPTEIDAIESQIKATQARIEFLQKEYSRRKELHAKKYASAEELEKTGQDLQVNQNQLRELQANLNTAKLPARDNEVKAAAAKFTATKADLAMAEWRLHQKSVTAPRDGFIFDTYYRVGERIPDNKAVLSILVSSDIKAIFFVPEPMLANLKIAQPIRLSCDSCTTSYAGKIQFISPIAEYTPPVIYSNSSRSKLVYRVEASISGAGIEHLHPGQPIDIQLVNGS
ncbi:MAG: HlyD family efflux transporter periplasmic adaptor subunit [Pseudomonadota bacterium]|nr:HlyD family efflux transporter periplasmic adaptor subunit [Pseudomonadota bacterium]